MRKSLRTETTFLPPVSRRPVASPKPFLRGCNYDFLMPYVFSSSSETVHSGQPVIQAKNRLQEYHGIPWNTYTSLTKTLRGRGKVASDHDDFTALLYQCDWRNGCRFASCGELCSTKRFGFATHGSFSLDPCASSCTSIGCTNLGSVGRSESCKTKDLAVCRSLVPGMDGGSCYFKSKPPNKHSWLEIPPWGFQPDLIIRMLH